MNILLVEDEHRLADSIREIFISQKYTCDIVYNGEDGLAYAESNIYDAIVLDIMLPKLNGFEVLKRIRSKKISTPTIQFNSRGFLYAPWKNTLKVCKNIITMTRLAPQ